MTFVVMERHQAPVATFLTYADVGSVQEVKGITGLAHIFEHIAFKGSPAIGGNNYEEERLALDRVDQAFFALRDERRKGAKADAAKAEGLWRPPFRPRRTAPGSSWSRTNTAMPSSAPAAAT